MNSWAGKLITGLIVNAAAWVIMSEKNQGQKKRRTGSTTEGTHSRPPASSMDPVYKESATE